MQRCISVPLTEGSGAFAALKSEKGIITSQTWAYLADQEGSGDSEASQFSSSSGRIPIQVQTSSMEPSVEEGLSSSIYIGPGIGIGHGDSDIVFAESDSDAEESVPVDTTMEDNDLYELDREESQLSEGGDAEVESDGVGDTFGDNEVGDVTPTGSESTTSYPEDGNVIQNDVRHSPPDPNNNLNIISPEHDNEVGGHKGPVDSIEKEAETGNDSDEMSGVPGNGIMAVVMFAGAIGAGALLSFLLVNLTKIGKKIFRKKPDP